MNLHDLYAAIREFTPVGGLLDWGVKIKFAHADGMVTFWISGRVPDRESGQRRKIEMCVVESEPTLMFRVDVNPREFVRDLIRKFVLHEADESIAFMRRPQVGSWSPDASPTPTAEPAFLAPERPFDPHRGPA